MKFEINTRNYDVLDQSWPCEISLASTDTVLFLVVICLAPENKAENSFEVGLGGDTQHSQGLQGFEVATY